MGTILPYVGDIKDIPKGWALCDGTNDTPDLTGRFLEGVTANPKIFKEEGLPNIEGSICLDAAYYHGSMFAKAPSGTFTIQYKGSTDSIPLNSIKQRQSYVYFSAKNSNPIYGNATKVQPSSYTVYYIMKIKK